MKASLLGCFLWISVSVHAQLTDIRHINFHRADSVADAYFGEPVTDLPALSQKLTRPFIRDEEKFRAIYKWVCNNIEFDYEVFRINREKRDKYDTPEALQAWNKKLTPVVFRNLILEKKTVCTGYAWLVQQLSVYSNITCVIVDGYGRNATANIRANGKPNHSWNVVKLNNKWYVCDPTWASGAYDADREMFIKKYDDSYFLTDPKVFIRNHFPVDSRWTLLEPEDSEFENGDLKRVANSTSPTLKEFLNGPLVYSSAYRHNITSLYPETFDISVSRNEAVNFRFGSDQVIEQIELAVHGPKKIEIVESKFSKNDEGLYCLNHSFTKKGRYIVHMKVNKSYAFTYTITVR